MNNPPPMNRAELIDRSLRCFVLGLWSLLPIIGLPIAAFVLMQNWRIQRRSRGMWNPAERFLRWACICASLGAGLSSLAAIVIGMLAALHSEPGIVVDNYY